MKTKISRIFLTLILASFFTNITYASKYFFKKNDAKTCQIKLPQHMPRALREKADKLLQNKLYQEAIWYLSKKEQVKNAAYVKKFLRNLMEKETFANFKAPLRSLGGATKPLVYLLPCDVNVVFKEKKSHPSSNYRSEIASYLIDDYFGFNLVPMTVLRKIRGKKGSLQYFVKNTQNIQQTKNYKKSTKLHIFDYILANKDRNCDNLLLLNDKEIAIDHGLALRKGNIIGKNLVFYDKFKSALNLPTDPVRSQIAYPRSSPQLFKKETKLLDQFMKIKYKDLKKLLKNTLAEENIKLLYSKISKLIYFTRD